MIKVIHPGFHASIQDLGRFNYRSIGVPVSGAMDQNASQRLISGKPTGRDLQK